MQKVWEQIEPYEKYCMRITFGCVFLFSIYSGMRLPATSGTCTSLNAIIYKDRNIFKIMSTCLNKNYFVPNM